jgi:rubredoxin
MIKYECASCGYVYDPEQGDPEIGIDPGTAFENLPDDWICPDCAVSRNAFHEVE